MKKVLCDTKLDNKSFFNRKLLISFLKDKYNSIKKDESFKMTLSKKEKELADIYAEGYLDAYHDIIMIISKIPSNVSVEEVVKIYSDNK